MMESIMNVFDFNDGRAYCSHQYVECMLRGMSNQEILEYFNSKIELVQDNLSNKTDWHRGYYKQYLDIVAYLRKVNDNRN